MKSKGTCCFCGQQFTNYGNNPAPVETRHDARCCNTCNEMIVIPARLRCLLLGNTPQRTQFLELARLQFCKEQ